MTHVYSDISCSAVDDETEISEAGTGWKAWSPGPSWRCAALAAVSGVRSLMLLPHLWCFRVLLACLEYRASVNWVSMPSSVPIGALVKHHKVCHQHNQ